MANMGKGEASFTTSDGQKLTLVVDFNALAEAEHAVNMGANDILAGLSKGRIKAMQGITLGALAARHPGMRLDDVNTLLQHDDDAGALAAALMAAVNAAFPKAGDANGTPDPRLPPGSTGTSSKRTGRQRA